MIRSSSKQFRHRERKKIITYCLFLNIHRKDDGQHGGCACASAYPDNT